MLVIVQNSSLDEGGHQLVAPLNWQKPLRASRGSLKAVRKGKGETGSNVWPGRHVRVHPALSVPQLLNIRSPDRSNWGAVIELQSWRKVDESSPIAHRDAQVFRTSCRPFSSTFRLAESTGAEPVSLLREPSFSRQVPYRPAPAPLNCQVTTEFCS